jgi:hypothetical protein
LTAGQESDPSLNWRNKSFGERINSFAEGFTFLGEKFLTARLDTRNSSKETKKSLQAGKA